MKFPMKHLNSGIWNICPNFIANDLAVNTAIGKEVQNVIGEANVPIDRNS